MSWSNLMCDNQTKMSRVWTESCTFTIQDSTCKQGQETVRRVTAILGISPDLGNANCKYRDFLLECVATQFFFPFREFHAEWLWSGTNRSYHWSGKPRKVTQNGNWNCFGRKLVALENFHLLILSYINRISKCVCMLCLTVKIACHFSDWIFMNHMLLESGHPDFFIST